MMSQAAQASTAPACVLLHTCLALCGGCSGACDVCDGAVTQALAWLLLSAQPLPLLAHINSRVGLEMLQMYGFLSFGVVQKHSLCCQAFHFLHACRFGQYDCGWHGVMSMLPTDGVLGDTLCIWGPGLGCMPGAGYKCSRGSFCCCLQVYGVLHSTGRGTFVMYALTQQQQIG